MKSLTTSYQVPQSTLVNKFKELAKARQMNRQYRKTYRTPSNLTANATSVKSITPITLMGPTTGQPAIKALERRQLDSPKKNKL